MSGPSRHSPKQPSAPHQLHPSRSYHDAGGPIDPRLGPSTSSHSLPTSDKSSTAATTHPAPFPAPSSPPHYTSQQRPAPHHYAPSAGNPRPESATSSVYASPQPYYHYPTPQSGTTPQGQPVAGAVANSSQATPDSYPNHNDGASPEHVDGQNPDDTKRPRACEACRGLKVRCDQDPAHPEIPCKRCAKAGRQCVITQPSRKRQKKSDSRVAELEKKLDALTAVLQQQAIPQAPAQYTPPSANAVSHQPQTHPVPLQHQGSTDHLPPLQNYGQRHQEQLPSLSRATSDRSYAQEPALKRRRTEDISETPTLDGADEEVPVPRLATSPRTSRQAITDKYNSHNDPWGPNADVKRYLDRSPQELCNRVHSFISPSVASDIFARFVTNLAPYIPVIIFQPQVTAEQVRKEKPILYTCILSAAAFGILPPDVSKQISTEAIGAIADSVVRNGNKSLELVQALQVLALWYRPPERAEQTNFYQIIHMAAAMALDIGLGKRFNAVKARRGFGGANRHLTPNYPMIPQDSDAMDARRAWLGCYYLCASSSMVLRRPNMVRWSNYMNECIEVLENSPDALPSDRLLCQHIKIAHICEEIGLAFLMDDNTASVSIQDPKVAYQLNVLESQLKSWREKIPPACQIPSLQFFEHVTNLYLHEIALHLNHNVDDFKLPFTEESLKSVNSSSDALTQQQMAALEACQKASQGILDTMLSFDIQVVQALPMLIFVVRCIYAVVILVKMHVAISTPGSELSKFMNAEDLRVEYYLNKLLDIYRLVAKDESFVADTKIVRILSVLRDWYLKHKANIEAQSRGEPLPYPPTTAEHGPINSSKSGQAHTPLHLLSQVATCNSSQVVPTQQHQQQQPSNVSTASSDHRDWTFNTPFVVDFSKIPHPRHPDSKFPVYQQQSSANPSHQPAAGQGNGSGDTYANNFDTTGFDAGDLAAWGSGFEQAMDIAIGGVDGLTGDGFDPWFLGDAMAPFAFNGDMHGVGGQW